jgi:hypothetical protein
MNTTKRRRDDDSDSEEERDFKVRVQPKSLRNIKYLIDHRNLDRYTSHSSIMATRNHQHISMLDLRSHPHHQQRHHTSTI